MLQFIILNISAKLSSANTLYIVEVIVNGIHMHTPCHVQCQNYYMKADMPLHKTYKTGLSVSWTMSIGHAVQCRIP